MPNEIRTASVKGMTEPLAPKRNQTSAWPSTTATEGRSESASRQQAKLHATYSPWKGSVAIALVTMDRERSKTSWADALAVAGTRTIRPSQTESVCIVVGTIDNPTVDTVRTKRTEAEKDRVAAPATPAGKEWRG